MGATCRRAFVSSPSRARPFVAVPAGLAAVPARPLVFAFHGGGSNARAMAERTGLQRTADDPDAVVLILVVGGGHTWPGSGTVRRPASVGSP